ncbi:DUF4286 family protein [Daejeonella oryzae]|uniref:DUF4286 family protein n=1 Tax=Daejeonella oryzae TaxID=1122943 RepID=UPI00047B3C91|nr:DUF4286 family protein [Daejeonella oryzae]
MILYNVTTILDEEIQHEWLTWMQDQHIADMMATSCFVSHRILKVIDSPNEGVTYCMQYTAENREKYEEYKSKYAPEIQASFPQKFANKFVIYRSLMEFVD